MSSAARAITFWLTLAAIPVLAQDAPIVIEAGKVVTMNAADEVINNAVVVIQDGRIKALGKRGEVDIPAGAKVYDQRDRWVVPGFIDCHDHIAGSLRNLNDGVWLTNPGLRTLDTISPENENLKNTLAGGVTTVLLIPGSGNNMSGFGTVTRTAGATVEAMVRRAPGSLKIAQAGNPERYWFGVGRSYMNWNLAQTLEKAKAYHERWSAWEAAVRERGESAAGPRPEHEIIWHDFRGVFTGEIPVTVHTQTYQVVMKTLVMLKDRFGLNVVLDHSTFDAYKTAPLILERGIPTIVGPRQFNFDRTQRRINGVASRYYDAGVRELGINTDAPVVAQEELTLQAAIGCRLGLDGYVALRALTIVPARALGIDADVGSIEVGKEADIGIWTGDPIDPRHSCELTIIGGKVVYDASRKRRF